MKFLLMILALSISMASFGKRIYVGKQGDGGTMITSGVLPGDTLVFRKSLSPWTYVYVSTSGLEGKPIVLTNEGGPVSLGGFSLNNALYLHITGTGSADFYGLRINQHAVAGNNGAGISITGKSAHIEADHFTIDSVGYGIWCKNEDFLDATLSAWVLDDIIVHDFQFRDFLHHGTYIGPTEVINKSRPNSKGQYLDPSRVGNIKIYSGLIRRMGKNGLMVSAVSTGQVEIFGVDIDTVGTLMAADQGTGIAIGGFSSSYIHDNRINHTWQPGIWSFGGPSIRIENNVVSNSGWSRTATQIWPQNIRVQIDAQDTTTAKIAIKNNTLIAPGKGVPNIQVYGKKYDPSSVICGNLVEGAPATMAVEPVVLLSCETIPTKPPRKIILVLYDDGTWGGGGNQ